jgi:molybdopterin converting factor small subunit
VGVRVNIHQTHRQFTDGLEVVEVDGISVGECLHNLVGRYPAMEKALFAEKGKLINTIEIYHNLESAYPDELARPVKDGDDIHITMLLAGG